MQQVKDYFLDGFPRASEQWRKIERAYAKRPYHNLDHLDEMLDHLRRGDHAPADAPTIFRAALVFHDFVYKAVRKDNEVRSADRAAQFLATQGWSQPETDRVRQLILATATHQPPRPDDHDAALLIDLDLAVLGRPRESYARYAAAVRREYWMIPGFTYRRGRKRLLKQLLGRPSIYHTDYGRAQYNGAARDNLRWELTQFG